MQLHAPIDLPTKRNALLDFNREKDGSFIPVHEKKDGTITGTPNLAIGQMTYDVFSVATHGLGGTFRPYRSDVGTIHDHKVYNGSVQGALGGEFGLFPFPLPGYHIGVNASATYSESKSGPWKGGGSDFMNKAHFTGKDEVNDPLYEPYYFKQIGELSVETDPDFIAHLGDDKLTRVKLASGDAISLLGRTENRLEVIGGTSQSEDTYHRTQRARRNQQFTVLTAEEASTFA